MLREEKEMNPLEQLMGLNAQGMPDGYSMQTSDPMLLAAMQGDNDTLMEGMGVPPVDDPYAMVGMAQPTGVDEGALLTQQMLGQPLPQFSKEEVNALAQAIGLNTSTSDPMTDPMYSQQFDLMSLLGGK